MIEKVMIQLGPKKLKKQRGGVISSSAARPHGTSEDSITGKLIPVKHLKRSGGEGAAIPPMMIEKVMIQLKARGGWGGRQPPPR